MAGGHGGTVIDDIVPGHTGKGADFRLAEMKYGTTRASTTWSRSPARLAPAARGAPGRDSINLDDETEALLSKAGYIIGKLQR